MFLTCEELAQVTSCDQKKLLSLQFSRCGSSGPDIPHWDRTRSFSEIDAFPFAVFSICNFNWLHLRINDNLPIVNMDKGILAAVRQSPI